MSYATLRRQLDAIDKAEHAYAMKWNLPCYCCPACGKKSDADAERALALWVAAKGN